MYKHFIFCRYNLELFNSNPYKVSNPDQWMVERIPMFRRLLRSLKYQTNKDYTFVVGMDKNTPREHLYMVAKTLEEFDINYVVVFGDPRTHIAEQSEFVEWIITSRIDNDDEYRPEFVEAIQSNFQEKTELLDVIGVQHDGKRFYTSGRPTPNSPFITLIEKWDKPKTVLHRPHSIMNGEYLARYASLDPLTIQHIHTSNAANRIIGKPINPIWK